ncbi:MAG: tetratricopeptide repeat protein, partial [Bacteroidota bacterium]
MLNKALFAVLALFISVATYAQKWENLNDQVLNYLGSGDYQNALSTALQARTVARQEFGENHADYSASLHNLASAHKKLGEYTPAESLYWEALKIDKQVLGAKHQNYALSLFGLANLYKLKKDYPKAESIYLDALDIMERAVTDKHPDYALILSDYADLHTELKNYKKAESNLKKAKDITRYSVGEKHQDYAGVLFNYGKLHKSKGSVSAAEESLIKALGIYKKTLGEDHPDYKDCKRFLDNLYDPTYQLYKPAASETQMTKTIERPSVTTTGDAATTTGNEINGGNTTMPTTDKKEMTMKDDMPPATNQVGNTNTGSNDDRMNVGNSNNTSTGAAVEGTSTNVETVVEKAPPVKTPPPRPQKKTWNDFSIEMDKYTQSGDYPQAISAGETALEMVRKEFGEEHENYTWISLKLADSYENAGLVEKAIPLYEKDLAYIAKSLGKDNRTYQKRREELLKAYKSTGQNEKAQQFYKVEVYDSYAVFNDASLMNQNKMIEQMEQEMEDYYGNSLEMGFLVSGTEMQNFNLGLKGRDTDAALLIQNSMKGDITTYQKQLRDKLKLNEAAIDFLRMKDKRSGMGNYYALVTRKGAEETVLVPLLDESKIQTLIDSKPDSRDSYIQSMDRSSQLYQLVWEPLEEHLKGVNFIHVSTVGILNKVA